MAAWNYHFDPVTREQKDWAIKVDREGGHWYPVRWSHDSTNQQNRAGLWKGIILVATRRMPMSAVLKDARSRRCASEFVFPIRRVGLTTDAEGRTLWLRLGVTPRGPGTTVDRIDRVPGFMSEWDLIDPATHHPATLVAMESEAQSEGWPEDSVRYGGIKARRG